MRWLVTAAVLIISRSAGAEPIRLVCHGETRSSGGTSRQDVVSITINLQTQTAIVGKNASVRILGTSEDPILTFVPSTKISRGGTLGFFDRLNRKFSLHIQNGSNERLVFDGNCRRAERL